MPSRKESHMSSVAKPAVVIINLGSQYTNVIARTLGELGIRSVVLPPEKAAVWFEQNPTKAVILSGGAKSVYDVKAPQPPENLLSLQAPNGNLMPILGICYGMQWLAHMQGGEVKPDPEYGEASIHLSDKHSVLFTDTPSEQRVWMSHGDTVITPPPGYEILARSGSGKIAAMRRDSLFGVQFHPEVTHTLFGRNILMNFLQFAGCNRDWQPTSVVKTIQSKTTAQLGSRKAVIGFSGGVDSTTLTRILAPVLGGNLLAITIDGGNLREKELEEIQHNAALAGVTHHRIIDARELFNQAMAGTIDAEEKRLRFKRIYTSLLVQTARDFRATAVIQGTLATDLIESGATGGDKIKSHHNVGNDMEELEQLHPLKDHFKYEIRNLARDGVGLPESVWNRQPFPGPGLFIRVVGVPATQDKLEIVRWADARTREILCQHDLYQKISQLVVGLLGVRTVGVKGDGRVYGWVIVIRPVSTSDFMTTQAFHLPDEVEDEILRTVTTHPEVVRGVFDYTEKPPATTEME